MFYLILIILIIFLVLYLNNKETFKNNNCYETAYELGINYLNSIEQNIQNIPKMSVMFDIDDTILYVQENNLKPIKPIIKLLNECIKRNILVIIITARDNKYREETINDLKKYKIRYSYLYCRQSPQDDHNLFKSNIKKNLLENYGINIVMSLGDNLVDIVGDYSGYCIKLPNKTNKKLYHIDTNGEFVEIVN